MRIAGLSIVILALVGATANGQLAWDEFANGGGDAGDLVATSQTPIPGGVQLIRITGTAAASDTDCYNFFIPQPAAFVATTDNGIGTLSDTQLFLFDKLTGNGVIMNDDSPIGTTLRSRLTGSASGTLDLGVIPAAGEYVLCIAGYNRDPVRTAGQSTTNIWATGSVNGSFRWENNPVGVYAGPGAPGPLAGWNNYITPGTGTYQIDLTGAFTKPEPATMALVGIGALLALRRRR
jgi:hypothetical protein